MRISFLIVVLGSELIDVTSILRADNLLLPFEISNLPAPSDWLFLPIAPQEKATPGF